MLDGPQRLQVIEMVKAGKSPEEIIGFVKQTYSVEINAQYVSNVKASLGGGGHKKQKRAYKKRGPGMKEEENIRVKDEKDMSIEEIARDVEALIRSSHEVYRGIFLHLRRELIKTVGKIRDLKKEFEMKAAAEASLAMKD